MREKTLQVKKIYRGKIIDLEIKRVKLPDGRQTIREIIKHPGAVAVVPFLPGGKVVLIRQFRKAVEHRLWEIPAGKLEGGESALTAARRELAEETGYRAARFKKIISFLPTPGISNETIVVYSARGLAPVKAVPDDDEFLEKKVFGLKTVREMIKTGRIKDGKTIIGLLLAKDS